MHDRNAHERDMSDRKRKGEAFRALHYRSHAFVIPNPWDRGSACGALLEAVAEMCDHGRFAFAGLAPSHRELNALFD